MKVIDDKQRAECIADLEKAIESLGWAGIIDRVQVTVTFQDGSTFEMEDKTTGLEKAMPSLGRCYALALFGHHHPRAGRRINETNPCQYCGATS